MLKLRNLFVFTLILFFLASPILCAQVLKDDFRVNDDTLGGVCYSPDPLILENGGEIIVWQDYRNATSNTYGQLFDSVGTPTGSNFKVSTTYGAFAEYNPAIALFGDSVLGIWEYRYGQWLLSDGSQSGFSFNMNSGNMYTPDVEISDSGFFAVWRYTGSGTLQDIFLKRFDFNGDSITPRIVLNDDGLAQNQYMPCIAKSGSGSFIVAWQDYRNGNADLYGQLVDPSGDTIGNNFLINDDGGSTYQGEPACAMDFDGNFVVVWYDARRGPTDIYGQRFDASGDTAGLGGNFIINDDLGATTKYEPWCAMDSAGNFIVVWIDYRNGDSDIYGQRFDNTGDTIGSNFRIDQESGSRDYWDVRVVMDDNKFVVTWYSTVNYATNIYKRTFLNDGTPLSNEFRVNELDGTAAQDEPAIDMNDGDIVVVTWEDFRDSETETIYLQRLDALGNVVGDNVRLREGFDPDVAVADDSSFALAFDFSNNIFFQKFNSSGDSVGPVTIISDTSLNSRADVSIGVDANNYYIVTWEDRRSGDYYIYAQIIDPAGDTVGGNFIVSDDPAGSGQYDPDIAVNPSGAFLIAWEDSRDGDYNVYGQLYDSGRNPIDSNFRIDSGGTSAQYSVDADCLPDGSYIVTWRDSRSPSGVYAQIVDSTGSLVDSNFRVSELGVSFEYPCVSAAPTGEFVITWRSNVSGDYNIYAQKYNADRSPDSTNFKVNNETESVNTYQYDPVVATNGSSILFAWEDPKWQRGLDIAAKVFTGWVAGIEDVTQAGNGVEILAVSSPILTGKEWLTVSLDSPSKVDFQIINVAGIVVSSKELPYTTPGEKRIEFDVSKLPSGPYFLSLKTDRGRAIKKTVVIR